MRAYKRRLKPGGDKAPKRKTMTAILTAEDGLRNSSIETAASPLPENGHRLKLKRPHSRDIIPLNNNDKSPITEEKSDKN